MRTTLNINDDILDKAKAFAKKRNAPVRQIVNEALRLGLQAIEESAGSRPYRGKSFKMGLKAGRNLDNIQELLAQVEGEDYR